MRTALSTLLIAFAIPIAATACGDNAASLSDAGIPGNDALSVLNPPGDAIGLNFSGQATLRVQLTSGDGVPLPGRNVEFSILQTGDESSGGSSLSDTAGRTNGNGIAEVVLVAGAERVNFRVEAKAENAPAVLFYIQVSDQGFSDVTIVTSHSGPRDPERYDRVELRIFEDRDVQCSSIDFASPPSSLFPPRTQAALGDESEFRNLAVGLGYTVIAWAEAGEDQAPHATGCLHIAADRLRSGSVFSAVMPVSDSPYRLPPTLSLQTRIDLEELAAALTGRESWAKLACPLGRSQLLLDCLADAQSPDGALDCEVAGTGPMQTALESRRGALGADGCRPATLAGGEESMDALLEAALSGWPTAPELDALVSGRDAVLGTLRVDSTLRSDQPGSAVHRLNTATVDTFTTDLAQTARPVLEVSTVPLVLDASTVLALGDHEFTLRYGELATAGYEALALEPANVSGLGLALGTELLDGAEIAAQSGCAALESFLCTELALGAGCADQCSTVAAALDAELGAWLGDLASSGLDFRFGLQAELVDENLDLVVDSMVAEDPALTTELTTTAGTFLLGATVEGSTE